MHQRDNAAMNDVEISLRGENCDVTASVAALDGLVFATDRRAGGGPLCFESRMDRCFPAIRVRDLNESTVRLQLIQCDQQPILGQFPHDRVYQAILCPARLAEAALLSEGQHPPAVLDPVTTCGT